MLGYLFSFNTNETSTITISVETMIAIVSAVVAIIATMIALRSIRQARQSDIRQATEVIFNKWWEEDLRELRHYFFKTFVPEHLPNLCGKGMKDIEINIPDDEKRVRRLCYFFDKVGWLGACGLINVDYVLGPMQHTLRRVWIVMEPFILMERESKPNGLSDPVFQLGFEWLYKRSSKPGKHQVNLLSSRFTRPRIRTKSQLRILKENIDTDEAIFENVLRKHLKSSEAKNNTKNDIPFP